MRGSNLLTVKRILLSSGIFNLCSKMTEIASCAISSLATKTALGLGLDFNNDDEMLEITPINIRIRKTHLSLTKRRVEGRRQESLSL